MSFLFLNERTLKGLRITLRLLGDKVPYNPLCINVNLNFTTDIILHFCLFIYQLLHKLEYN